MSDARKRARAAVLELLERRHGIGARAERLPAWVQLRLDRALDALAAPAEGQLDAAVEILRTDSAELAQVAELLRVGETCFFRDPPSWEALRSRVLPEFRGREWIRAISAGCSTGEEAWTLAMLIDDARTGEEGRKGVARHGNASGRGIEEHAGNYRVIGLDRSEVALATARDGVYPTACARHVPAKLAGRYLTTEADTVRVVDSLRRMVSFVPRDVMLGPPPGSYEIIVCKNVLIYFGAEAGQRAADLLLRSLAERGVLLVARSEVPRLRAMGHRGEEIAPAVTVFRA